MYISLFSYFIYTPKWYLCMYTSVFFYIKADFVSKIVWNICGTGIFGRKPGEGRRGGTCCVFAVSGTLIFGGTCS